MQKTSKARYYNSNGYGICIMASVTEGVNWAAYIGADNGWSESNCMRQTLQEGSKLSEEDARYFYDYEPFESLPYRQ